MRTRLVSGVRLVNGQTKNAITPPVYQVQLFLQSFESLSADDEHQAEALFHEVRLRLCNLVIATPEDNP